MTDTDCGELPEGGGHWYRSILVDDHGFYTSIGDDSNASDHTNDDREKIWHYNLDGGWCFTKTPILTGQIGDAIIAFHGSWNSSRKVGYCIQRIEFDPVTGKPCGSTTLVSALVGDARDSYMARFVDCTEAPDGSVLFSADDKNQVYRIAKVDTK